MEMHQLRYVVAVAETGSFTRAAERCFVAQPSLSQQVRKLEDELEHPLFHRLGRRAIPTEAGHFFLDRARQILFEVENTTKQLKDDSVGRRISVGAIPTIAPYLLPPVISRCRDLHADIEINTYENFRGPLIEAVVQGEADVALVPMPVNHPQLVVEPLFVEPLLLALAKDHPLLAKEQITLRDLDAEDFVLLGDSSSLASQVLRFFGDRDLQLRLTHRCAQVATVKALVARRLGISILPRLARAADDTRRIAYRELAGRSPTREIALIRHRQRYQSTASAQFLDAMKLWIEEHRRQFEPLAPVSGRQSKRRRAAAPATASAAGQKRPAAPTSRLPRRDSSIP